MVHWLLVDWLIGRIVISSGAMRSGEIYPDRFSFAEPSGYRLRCTSPISKLIDFRLWTADSGLFCYFPAIFIIKLGELFWFKKTKPTLAIKSIYLVDEQIGQV